MPMPPVKLRIFAGVAAAVLAADFLTKHWVVAQIPLRAEIPVIPGFFSLTYITNPGAAFSLLATAPDPWRHWFFLCVGFLAVGLLVALFRKLAPGERLSAFALGAILGGALGNLGDRMFRNPAEVVDFLRFYLFAGYRWPDFNLADSFIVIGVALLLRELFTSQSGAETA